jgi:GH25 family lysozyme M1 (1,4-beta-N-acetylmuramidase)
MKKILDISKWQGDSVDFKALAGDVEFVILRTQYGSTTEDTKHKDYENACIANNIPFGSYAYGRFVSVADAKVEAKDYLARTNPNAKFLAIDVEEVTTKVASDLPAATQAFIDYVKANDKRPIGLYTGEYFYKSHGLDNVKADFLWIAKYGANDGAPHDKPVVPCDLWQFTSTGHVAGISGNVDLSVLNGDKDQYYFGVPKPVVVEAPKPAPKPVVKKPADTWTKTVTHKVQSGDNLSSIAHKYGVSVDSIVVLNHIADPNKIYVGQKLLIKSGTAVSTVTPKPAPKPVYHKVVSGDTVSELAAKYGSKAADIKAWNKLDYNYTIFVGQNLRVK